jgi:hypothetical protein
MVSRPRFDTSWRVRRICHEYAFTPRPLRLVPRKLSLDGLRLRATTLKRRCCRPTAALMTGYDGALAAISTIPWHLAKSVTPIAPRNFQSLNFFPGRRGFIGPEFPIHGVMMVANNYDCLGGWITETDEEDESPTWRRMKNIIVPESEIPLREFWFTNYCHGVMDSRDKNGKPDPCYSFPANICSVLDFRRVFEDCVVAMEPKVIVALGCDADHYLRFPRGEAEERVIAGHPTMVLSAFHTSARVSLDKFILDAKRIGRAYRQGNREVSGFSKESVRAKL